MIKIKEFPIYSEDFLRQKSVPIFGAGEAVYVKTQLEEMFPETGALAVASPQIGILKRASLIKLPSNGDFLFICNPEILEKEQEIVFKGEGCLSFPKDHRETIRFNRVKVRYFDEYLEEHTVIAEGIEAVVFQHEIDHLDGVLYKDHVIKPIRLTEPKIGRNDPCPCGSGKKFKKCCIEVGK